MSTQASKTLPKRASNAQRKVRREKSFARSKERKEERRIAQELRHRHNQKNMPSPWEVAKGKRYDRRHPNAAKSGSEPATSTSGSSL